MTGQWAWTDEVLALGVCLDAVVSSGLPIEAVYCVVILR
jgi:hypothetical protein